MAWSEYSTRLRPVSTPQFTNVKRYTQRFAGKPIYGDVFTVKCDDKICTAGVYSEGQIIELKKSGMFSNYTYACKVNIDQFTGGNNYAIYRKLDGIPPSFTGNLNEAISRSQENEFSTHNCIEFIMELFDINLQPTKSDCLYITRGSKPKGFKVVKNFSDDFKGKVKLGDLLMKENVMFGGDLHAGVCCREKGPEIIQLTESGVWSGVVSKVHLNTFSGGRKYAIYRRKKGIPDLFKVKVDEAMSRSPVSKTLRYTSINFALEFLCGNLEKTRPMDALWCELSHE